MDSTILAQRQAIAQQRAVAALDQLAAVYHVTLPLSAPPTRDQQMRSMFEWERQANVLEQIIAALVGRPTAEAEQPKDAEPPAEAELLGEPSSGRRKSRTGKA